MLTFDHFDAIDCLLKTQIDPEMKVVLFEHLMKDKAVEMSTLVSDEADGE